MKQNITAKNNIDTNGNPTGGTTVGVGIRIDWQNGPLGRGADRIEPNGAFVEGVIAAAIDRLAFFQKSKFACRENAIALTHLETALLWLEKRTAEREAQEVEGTHTPHVPAGLGWTGRGGSGSTNRYGDQGAGDTGATIGGSQGGQPGAGGEGGAPGQPGKPGGSGT